MCPRKQTTEPKLMILVSFFSGEVFSYIDTSYLTHILWEVSRSIFSGPPQLDTAIGFRNISLIIKKKVLSDLFCSSGPVWHTEWLLLGGMATDAHHGGAATRRVPHPEWRFLHLLRQRRTLLERLLHLQAVLQEHGSERWRDILGKGFHLWWSVMGQGLILKTYNRH